MITAIPLFFAQSLTLLRLTFSLKSSSVVYLREEAVNKNKTHIWPEVQCGKAGAKLNALPDDELLFLVKRIETLQDERNEHYWQTYTYTN